MDDYYTPDTISEPREPSRSSNFLLKHTPSKFVSRRSDQSKLSPRMVPDRRGGWVYSQSLHHRQASGSALQTPTNKGISANKFSSLPSHDRPKSRRGFSGLPDSIKNRRYRDLMMDRQRRTGFPSMHTNEFDGTPVKRRPLPPIPVTSVVAGPRLARANSYFSSSAPPSALKGKTHIYETDCLELAWEGQLAETQSSFKDSSLSIDLPVAERTSSTKQKAKPDEAQAIWKMIDKMMGAVNQTEVLLAREEMKQSTHQLQPEKESHSKIHLEVPPVPPLHINPASKRRKLLFSRRKGRVFSHTEQRHLDQSQLTPPLRRRSSHKSPKLSRSLSATSLFSVVIQPATNQISSSSSGGNLGQQIIDIEALPPRLKRILITRLRRKSNRVLPQQESTFKSIDIHPDIVRTIQAFREDLE